MTLERARRPLHVWRQISLLLPSAFAWQVAFSARDSAPLAEAVILGLGPLWLVTAAALLARAVDAAVRRRDGDGEGPTVLESIDVLTASGSAVAWVSAGLIMAAVWTGWASLSVVGLVGSALLHLCVVWTCLRASGDAPWRRMTLTRRFAPERPIEGDPVTEELRLEGLRIPSGFRLFARGCIGARWATSRYVVSDTASDGEVLLQAEVGPAVRGEHDAEPLEVWLQDVFGLCRSAVVRAGARRLTVVPRVRAAFGARLLGRVGSDGAPQAARRLPTEGSLHLREYRPGDDARRIHWMRSLASRDLIVRLPDEVPPERPRVELLLDAFHPANDALQCDAPAALLDALVAVWLGVGRALLEGGAEVTLVTAVTEHGRLQPVRRKLTRGTLDRALALGAQVRWQRALRVETLLEGAPAMGPRPRQGTSASGCESIVVSWRLADPSPSRDRARWVVVPQRFWAGAICDESPPLRTPAVLPHPMGSADNRASRRRRERLRRQRTLADHATFALLCAERTPAHVGSFLARPRGGDTIQLEALS